MKSCERTYFFWLVVVGMGVADKSIFAWEATLEWTSDSARVPTVAQMELLVFEGSGCECVFDIINSRLFTKFGTFRSLTIEEALNLCFLIKEIRSQGRCLRILMLFLCLLQ